MQKSKTARRSGARRANQQRFKTDDLRLILADIGERTDGDIDLLEATGEAVRRWTAVQQEYRCPGCKRTFELLGQLRTHRSARACTEGDSNA